MSEPTPKPNHDHPFKVAVEAGKTYNWCACGNTKTEPMCDGSHRGGTVTPLSYTADATGEVFFCGCKHSLTKPLCDGSHKMLK